MKEIDIWFGIDSGQAEKLEGELVSVSERNGEVLATIKITDKEFLDRCGDDGPCIQNNVLYLGKDKWVNYDSFRWSYKGDVLDSELSDPGLLTGKRERTWTEADSRQFDLNCKFTDYFKNKIL